MNVQSGIGLLAFATVAVHLAAAAYLGYWVREAALRGARGHALWESRVSVAAIVAIALAVVPLSYANLGWVIVPMGLVVVSFGFVATHGAIARAATAEARAETVTELLAFAVPLALTVPAVTAVALWQADMARASVESSLQAMAAPGLVSVLLLGAVPPLVALAAVLVACVRQRRGVHSGAS